jgi:hypothetical protein
MINTLHLNYADIKDSPKIMALDIEITEIQCGVTLWNSTAWHKASLPINVTGTDILIQNVHVVLINLTVFPLQIRLRPAHNQEEKN